MHTRMHTFMHTYLPQPPQIHPFSKGLCSYRAQCIATTPMPCRALEPTSLTPASEKLVQGPPQISLQVFSTLPASVNLPAGWSQRQPLFPALSGQGGNGTLENGTRTHCHASTHNPSPDSCAGICKVPLAKLSLVSGQPPHFPY